MSENTESELPAGGGWRPGLEVRNFGPIAEGAVEIRPLTVFAGPSNTGKSWLATLIYAMTRHANAGYGPPGFGSRIRLRGIDNGLKNFPENPTAWLERLREGKALHLTDSERQALKSVLEGGQEAFKEELLRCFSLTEARHLVREGNTGTARVTFMNAAPPHPFTTRQRLTIGGEEGFSLGADVMTDEYRMPSEYFLDIFMETLEDLIEDFVEPDNGHYHNLSSGFKKSLLSSLAGIHWHTSAYYLPADRGGIMHTHRTVVGGLVRSASRVGSARRSPPSTLSGVLGDFLEELIDLTDHPALYRDNYNSLGKEADRFEKNILGGKVKIRKSDVDYPQFTYRPEGWKRDLSLMSVSSMVSELAPVALFLHHCVGKDDLLILEEPEAHLHPAMQVRFVREIADWVRQGIRVLITTHSEWVLEEVSNLVAAGERKAEGGLKKQDVGMWLFEPNGTQASGSNIREIEWSVDEGGYALDFDDVAMELHNKWAGLVGVEE